MDDVQRVSCRHPQHQGLTQHHQRPKVWGTWCYKNVSYDNAYLSRVAAKQQKSSPATEVGFFRPALGASGLEKMQEIFPAPRCRPWAGCCWCPGDSPTAHPVQLSKTILKAWHATCNPHKTCLIDHIYFEARQVARYDHTRAATLPDSPP